MVMDGNESVKSKNSKKEQKNNTRDSNVVPHRSTNLARQCLTSLSSREAILSLWYGRSCRIGTIHLSLYLSESFLSVYDVARQEYLSRRWI